MNSNLASQLDKAMTQEQFTQVVDAILDGKYSWACVLILRFAGYNPLHYIPYRTYSRLIKENDISREPVAKDCETSYPNKSLPLRNCLTHLEDLGYLETATEHSKRLHGGSRHLKVEDWFIDLSGF